MTTASFKLCVKLHALRWMHFMGMSEKVAASTPLVDWTFTHIKQSIEVAVRSLKKRVPDARVVEAALDGLHMRVSIERLRKRVRKKVVNYLERMENIGYGSCKDDNAKITVAHLTKVKHPARLKLIVVKDLEYRQNLKNNFE